MVICHQTEFVQMRMVTRYPCVKRPEIQQNFLDPKIALKVKSTDKADAWSKEFMLKVSFISMLFVSNCSQSCN